MPTPPAETKPEVSEKLEAVFIRMANYLARTVRPSGYGLLNNDSDLDDNRGRILSYAERFNRPDWRYIATNGKEGEKPKGPASYFLPMGRAVDYAQRLGRERALGLF